MVVVVVVVVEGVLAVDVDEHPGSNGPLVLNDCTGG